jgi:hypothetical protein
VLAARLDEDRRQETERYLAAQVLANSEELADKAAVWVIMRRRRSTSTPSLCLLPTPWPALCRPARSHRHRAGGLPLSPGRPTCLHLRWAPM